MLSTAIKTEIEQIIHLEHSDPFHILGAHPLEIPSQTGNPEKAVAIRAFLPEAQAAWVVENDNPKVPFPMEKLHPDGFFQAIFRDRSELFSYQLRILDHEGQPYQFIDPYTFPPVLTEFDLHLIGEGSHYRKYEKLGAHPREIQGIRGLQFAVWAPNAKRVSVIGDFNRWDGRRGGEGHAECLCDCGHR